MKKVLFLHGFFASGSCVPAKALREALKGIADVLTPDLPLLPREALESIRCIIDRERPDVLIGNSCGSFYAQMAAPLAGVPAILGNPHFDMAGFLEQRIGEHEYKSPRADGNQKLVIDDALVEEFREMQERQFDFCSPFYRDRVWGLFGESDTLAQYEPVFMKHYNRVFHFPGGHTPTEQEVRNFHGPLVQKMLMTFGQPADGVRYFQHFKGGRYRYIRTALDSETQERMVIYQALYGEQKYWVRPEKMFFEHIERGGRTFPRFIEMERE